MNSDWIVHRVLAAARLYATAPPVSRSAFKEVREVSDEITKLIKQGKGGTAARKEVLTFEPLLFRAVTGRDLSTARLGAATTPKDILDPDVCPDADLFIRTLGCAMAVRWGNDFGTEDRPGAPEGAVALFSQWPATMFVNVRALEFGAPNVFMLHANIAERLLATSVDGVRGSDVKGPFPGFYIQIPPGLIQIRRDARDQWSSLVFIGVADGYSADSARCLVTVFSAEGDAFTQTHSHGLIPLPDGDLTEEAVAVEGAEVRFSGEELPPDAAGVFLRKFIINFCLYLSSPNPDIEPTTGGRRSWGDTITLLEEAQRSSPELRRKLTPGKNYNIWDAGRKTTKLLVQKTDVVVRGHWRRQVHGPRWSLRKIIWIEPFVRLPTGIEAPGHDYDVKKNKRSSKRASKRSSKRSSKRTSRRWR